jgi:hypothetical protein
MLIGISGKLGSGKSAAYDALKTVGGPAWEKVQLKAFAHKIKEIVAIITGTTVADQYDQDVKNKNPFELVNFRKETENDVCTKVVKIVASMTETTPDEQFPEDCKEAFSSLYGKPLSELQGDVFEYYTTTFRMGALPSNHRSCGGLQQHLGMFYRAKYGEDIWVKTLFHTFNPTKDFWIITDVRFLIEIKGILEHQSNTEEYALAQLIMQFFSSHFSRTTTRCPCYLIRMEGDPKGVRARSKRDPNHISETELDNYTGWHAVIDNSKDDLGNLQSQIAGFISKYKISLT